MAKTPFYRVLIQENEVDITENVTRLSYDDCIDKDDLVTITLDKLTLDWIDNTKLNKGTVLIFTFGYLGGDISPKRLCAIKDIEVSYNATISMTIKALDQGLLLKKLTSNRVWTNVKVSDIFKSVANDFGLKYEVEETEKVHPAIPQGNKTFYAFLQELTNKEGSGSGKKGSWQFYLKGDTIYFVQRDLSKDSIRTFTYGNGDDIVRSFKPKYEQKKGESEEVSSSGIDLDSNKAWTEKSNVSDSKETGVGVNKIVYDINGKVVKTLTEMNTGKAIVPDSTKQSEEKKKVVSKQKDAELKELTASLSIEGDPLVESGKIITVAGVAQKHAGNWYIISVIHTVGNGGYMSDLKLNKNAAIKPPLDDKKKVENQNKTAGDKTSVVEKEVPVIKYDINGNEVK